MNELNYLHLYYFWTTAKERGFLRASKTLRVSQSTVSTQIRLLEKTLGRPLILRGPRSFELTDDGRKTFASCERIFSAGQDLLRDLGQGEGSRKTLRVGYDFSVPALACAEFLDGLKTEGLSFQLERQSTDALLEKLSRLQVDVALCGGRPSQMKLAGVLAKKFRSSPVALVGKARWQRKAEGDPKDWSTIPLCLPSISDPARRAFENWAHRKKIVYQTNFETSDLALSKNLAVTGRAVSLLPLSELKSELEKSELVVLQEFRDTRTDFYAFKRKGLSLTAS